MNLEGVKLKNKKDAVSKELIVSLFQVNLFNFDSK